MAHMWLNIMVSGQLGTREGFYMAAKAQLALLRAKMIPSQIAEAQKLAHEEALILRQNRYARQPGSRAFLG
jgi:hypothetical protein